MATPKGYTSQNKEDRLSALHTTVSKAGADKVALDVRDVGGSVTEVGTDAAEAGSTTTHIVATGHAALEGDTIRFTSGALTGIEAGVWSIPDANTIQLDKTLSSAPSPGDTFSILRPVTLTLTSSGGFSSVNTFVRDGSNQVVTEDTVTPANNRPLPVKLTGLDGDVSINAANLNLEVQLDHDSANPDSVQIGDGTEVAAVNASNELNVRDDDANTSLSAIATSTAAIDADLDVALSTRASESTLSTINGKLIDGNDIGDVTINNAPGASAVNIQDGGNSITVDDGGAALTVDAVELDIRPLDHTTDSVVIGDGIRTAVVTTSFELMTSDNDVNTTLSTINGKLVDGNDIGDVTINNAGGASAVNIQDGGNSISVDDGGTNLNVQANDLDIRDLSHGQDSVQIGDGTETAAVSVNNELQVVDDGANTSLSTIAGAVSGSEMQVDIVASLPAGTNTIGAVDVNTLDVVDFFDTPLLDVSSSNIPGSAGSPLEVVASLASDVSKIQVFDTTGGFFGIYTGAAASEVLVAVVGPGSNETIEVSIASGTRISLLSLSTDAIDVGNVTMNFIG